MWERSHHGVQEFSKAMGWAPFMGLRVQPRLKTVFRFRKQKLILVKCGASGTMYNNVALVLLTVGLGGCVSCFSGCGGQIAVKEQFKGIRVSGLPCSGPTVHPGGKGCQQGR